MLNTILNTILNSFSDFFKVKYSTMDDGKIKKRIGIPSILYDHDRNSLEFLKMFIMVVDIAWNS